MAQQRKHKKRKHNNRNVEQSAVQAASVASETEEDKAALAKSAKAAAKEQEKAEKAAAKERAAKAKAKEKAAKPGIFRRFVNWCKAVRAEMQRVVWPTRHELVNASLIVIGAIIFFGVYIAIIDNIIIIPLSWISSLGA